MSVLFMSSIACVESLSLPEESKGAAGLHIPSTMARIIMFRPPLVRSIALFPVFIRQQISRGPSHKSNQYRELVFTREREGGKIEAWDHLKKPLDCRMLRNNDKKVYFFAQHAFFRYSIRILQKQPTFNTFADIFREEINLQKSTPFCKTALLQKMLIFFRKSPPCNGR